MGRKSYTKDWVRASTGREVLDLLRELYIEKRHSDQEIAEAIGVSRTLVRQWRIEYGISRDDRPAVAL
jgi:response regulator of citrate/malate metabolism